MINGQLAWERLARLIKVIDSRYLINNGDLGFAVLPLFLPFVLK